MKRVAVFVSNRADAGPLSSVIQNLRRLGGSVTVILGLEDKSTLIRQLQLQDHDEVIPLLGHDSRKSQTPFQQVEAGSDMARALGMAIQQQGFERLVVLGDRWELGFVAPVCLLNSCDILHIHGGEVTLGAIDDRIRHATTKYSDIHCVANEDARRFLLAMGEENARVFVTGAPGLDRFHEGLASIEGADERPAQASPTGLVTIHPETADSELSPAELATEVLQAADGALGSYIVTDPGWDAGREDILAVIEAHCEHSHKAKRVPSLGPMYVKTMASVDVVLGNSSSGIIEAASVPVPAVNVGDRQLGRFAGCNVFHVAPIRNLIQDTIKDALVWQAPEGFVNPYGTGGAGEEIAAVALKAEFDRRKQSERN